MSRDGRVSRGSLRSRADVWVINSEPWWIKRHPAENDSVCYCWHSDLRAASRFQGQRWQEGRTRPLSWAAVILLSLFCTTIQHIDNSVRTRCQHELVTEHSIHFCSVHGKGCSLRVTHTDLIYTYLIHLIRYGPVFKVAVHHVSKDRPTCCRFFGHAYIPHPFILLLAFLKLSSWRNMHTC